MCLCVSFVIHCVMLCDVFVLCVCVWCFLLFNVCFCVLSVVDCVML